MRITKLSAIVGMLFLVSCSSTEIIKGVNDVLNDSKSPLSQEETGRALKEALEIGITKGASVVSRVDGYFKNPRIKIPFPPKAVKVEKTLRDMGLGSQVDKVVLTLNRAAEEAAKEAKPVFVDAIRKMTFSDAINILKGGNNAATEYLKRTTSSKLSSKFKPIIKKNLDKVQATKHWTNVINTYNKIPLVDKVNPDLVSFVNQKALNGLFFMVAKEELKIRKDPVARTTALLKKVFGYYE